MSQHDTYQAAMRYIARGWQVIALHHITAARQCSCGKIACKSAGKHPVDKGWTTGGGVPASRWAPRTPGSLANIGILTGRPSGHWVLDFDPNAADEDGWTLHRRLVGVTQGGWTPHVRTGGDGEHWRFALPDFEVRNSQGTARTHRLPAGWDVRGDGGQVVAPPSVSGKGAYVELIDVGPYLAPEWLLELIRPRERVTVNGAPPGHMVSAGPTVDLVVPNAGASSGLGGSGVGDGSSHRAEQVQAYCTAALRAEVEEYSHLTDGRRGEAAFAFGCSLVEIANLARWSHERVYEHFAAAMERAAANAGPDGQSGGYAPHEVPNQWSRAVEHVGARARVMPAGPDVIPFLPIVDAGSVNGGGGSSSAAGRTAATGPTPAAEVPPVLDPFEAAVRTEAWRITVREAAKRRVEEWKLGDRKAAVAALRAELIDTPTLLARPRLVPVVPGLFYRNSLSRLIGSTGHGKSFVALDLAARIGAGLPWAGRPVTKGSVLWLVAEGDEGVGARLEAWSELNERPVENVTYLPRAVNSLGPEWDIFVEAVADRRDDMIILDTQARVTPGADEIDRAEQSMLVEACDRLRAATGACVVLVHHRGAKGVHARGHTEVLGALQTQVYVEKNGNRITVGAKAANGGKTKDDVEPEDIAFILKPVIVPGRPNEFGIVEPGAKGAALEWVGDAVMAEDSDATRMSAVDRRTRALWRIVVDEFNPGDGGARAEIRAHFVDLPEISAMKPDGRRKAWQRSWNALISLGLVAKHVKGARFKIVEVADQSAAGVLTANPDAARGGVGRLNYNWELWTDDMESKDPDKGA
jgi:hypothetical protein